ncbi:S9 family peptidase [Hydrogenophaga sp.]|uniref:alpha/beta hydrolase family protein n=1 Tax=Hydrogenophaga sp. TaxID=1904254 RepID=UPI00272676AF|nr:alpha/beta hydrolase [Hydrogenophaga sp.]MDO9436394.1 alpha/beta hydrolase [Hydrogenophaga sp.]
MKTSLRLRVVAWAATALVAACGGGGGGRPEPEKPAPVVPEETRAQDSKTYTPANPAATTFAAMAGVVVGTDRWAGVLNGASYQVEVPAAWNGKLVMYAHGYAGEVPTLNVAPPSIRRYLIENGYAWAASSYSKNSYDVRAGVEDTNALALAFNNIASANGRALPTPSRLYITGHSMGGHITGAAIEEETYATARNKVRYHGAVPMCGVMGDTDLFNRFAGMQVTAQALAGVPSYPFNKWSEIQGLVTNTLFAVFNNTNIVPTAQGVKYLSVVENLTGGDRPLFDQGVLFGQSFQSAYGLFGSDGTVFGILNKNILDTNAWTYVIDGDVPGSAALNASVLKLTAAPDANRLRRDGLRWIPAINGDFKVPVVSIHTLGDLFVPFSMQQVYQQRAAAKGNSGLLVQRAIRGASHCDFTNAEQVQAFVDMVAWAEGGPKPAGDDVVTPATVAAPTYGCAFTNNTLGPDDVGTAASVLRPAIANALPGVCPP